MIKHELLNFGSRFEICKHTELHSFRGFSDCLYKYDELWNR